MLSRNSQSVVSISMLLLLGSCGHFDGERDRPSAKASLPPAEVIAPDEANAKIGNPYEVKGESYTPSDNTQYDEVGYASWYGDDFAGKPTSNGEIFNPAAITAAHKTLPMPSYVEVTNLDTGKTILVRVNDRGPFAANRIIDLSQGAAQQLGVEARGAVPVRVRRVNPPEQEKTVLRQGQRAAERLDTPPSLLAVLRKHLPGAGGKPVAPVAQSAAPVVKPVAPLVKQPFPAPSVDPVPTPGNDRFVVEDASGRSAARPKPVAPSRAPAEPAQLSGTWLVQVASFSSHDRAKASAARVGGHVQASGAVHRVVVGPFISEAAAQAALRSVSAKGYRDARIVH